MRSAPEAGLPRAQAARAAAGALLLGLCAAAAGATSADFGPEADTYVNFASPATNYGGDDNFRTCGPLVPADMTRKAYIRFHVDIPAGSTVSEAKLILVVMNRGGGGTIRLFTPTVEQWDEMTPTWTGPLQGTEGATDLATLGTVELDTTYEFTGLEAAVTAAGRYTFVIVSDDPDGSGYWSREYATASERPILRVVYEAGVPKPAVTTLEAMDVTADSARLQGEVTSTGGEDPAVKIYWGTTDGGTTAASWESVEDLGTLGVGTFYADVTGLTPGDTYYFRCHAENTAGGAWASETKSFDTLAGPPVLSAVEVTPASANILPGATRDFTAEPRDQYGEAIPASVAWTVTGGGTLAPTTGTTDASNTTTGTTFTSDGTEGTFTVAATATDGTDTATGTAEITVAELKLTAVRVTPTRAEVDSGGTQGFTAEPRDQYAAPFAATVTWEVSGGGSVSPLTGETTTFTSDGTEGTFTVTATATAGADTAQNTAKVTVLGRLGGIASGEGCASGQAGAGGAMAALLVSALLMCAGRRSPVSRAERPRR